MRGPEGVVRTPVPSRTRTAQRRARLRRGLERWNLDRLECPEPTWRIATVTLTIPEDDPAAAIGRVYKFLAKVRQRWLGTRYFCWLEVQKRGAPHYHMLWLNPPSFAKVNLQAWVARAWGEGRTQVKFKRGREALQHELEYALKHTDKMGKKAYQQRYEDIPSQLRTFMTQRLDYTMDDLDHQLPQQSVRYVPETVYAGQYYPPFLELHGVMEHRVPIGGHCTQPLVRRQPYRKKPRGPTAGGGLPR